MTDHPDWVIKRARELAAAQAYVDAAAVHIRAGYHDDSAMMLALRDHIALHENPPVDRDEADAAGLMSAWNAHPHPADWWCVKCPEDFSRVVTKLREIIAERVAEALAA